ncbi:T9SS type A sorting domain-containing protein [Flavivirga eckloniae]|uniref:Secretion system C-terminal sorting domain-containing protein n=1 Tax=Flavivirga eckloniae TaxID=1803846 RepID=A0A2K9PR79_9FLAO|nr:T9SS type A sorting domain-containing protein [Flavivirga eckloniae]AUP79564.1 hypothetical protein C1H87_12935 [Flavivirga eckloniae]
MKTKNYFLGLTALLAVTTINAQSFGVDITLAESAGVYASLGGTTASPGFNVPANATAVVPSATAGTTSDVTFTMVEGGPTRDRAGSLSDVLRDFVFGSATLTVQISGLDDNTEYTIESFHLEGLELYPARMSVELREVGGGVVGAAQIIDNNPPSPTDADDINKTGWVFTTGVGKDYEIVSTWLANLQDDPPGGVTGGPQTRNRFNGVLVSTGNVLSTSNIGEVKKFNVSPNPFQESFNLNTSSQSSYTKAIIYDSIGREVNSIDANESEITVNGPSGIYFLVLYNQGNVIATKKLLKK